MTTAGASSTLALGLDDSREGWRYRGRVIKVGDELSWTTDRYVAHGRVTRLDVTKAAQ